MTRRGQRGRFGRGRLWSAREDEVVRQWVAAQGGRWAALLQTGLLGERTFAATRMRWADLVRTGRALPTQPPEARVLCGAAEDAVDWGTQHADRAELGVATSSSCSESGEAEEAQPTALPAMRALRPLRVTTSLGTDSRRLAHGRSWTQVIRQTSTGARAAAPREEELLEGWGVDGSGRTRATVVPRSQEQQRRGKAASESHFESRQKLPTLMESRVRVPIVSGDAAGGVRPLAASECARLMGIDTGTRAWRVAATRLPEAELWRAASIGLDARVVRLMWENAEDMAVAQGRTFRRGAPLSYASMFSGALDTTLLGGQAEGWWARCLACAERDERRRECVGEAYLVPLNMRFASAEDMARSLDARWCRLQLDALCATPSCRLLSAAQRTKGRAARAALQARAREQLLLDIAAVKLVAQGSCPTVIFLEETAGLKSHHKALYAELQEELRSWPYEWRHGRVDCADLGAAHHRRRLVWVGVLRAGVRAFPFQ